MGQRVEERVGSLGLYGSPKEPCFFFRAESESGAGVPLAQVRALGTHHIMVDIKEIEQDLAQCGHHFGRDDGTRRGTCEVHQSPYGRSRATCTAEFEGLVRKVDLRYLATSGLLR